MPKATTICLNCGTPFEYRPSTSRGKYCSNQCQQDLKSRQLLEANTELFEQGQLTNRHWIYRILAARDNSCKVCGITEWNDKPIRLWVDHIDGDATNNAPTNMRLICPNCDCQSDTFGAKNTGRGRKSRGLPTYG